MAYTLKYTCKAFNRLAQLIDIEFYSNTLTGSSTQLPLISFSHEYINGDQDKYNPINIGSRAVIKIRAKKGSDAAINNEMFYADESNEWLVFINIDTVPVFRGFITNDVEPYVLKDKPYDIVITCTDGLGLIKNDPLTDIAGDQFNGRHFLIEYLAGALKKTGLDLNIRLCLNVYNNGQDDRFDAGSPDTFTQTMQHYKTYEKDVNSFYDCYESLERLLSGFGCVCFQYMGMWVVSSRAELQDSSGPAQYYSDYDSDGVFISATYDLNGVQVIGKNLGIISVNLEQFVSYQPAIKSAVTRFKYRIPPNLVNNQRLQNLGSFISPLSGIGYAAWQLFGWGKYQGDPNTLTPYAGAANAYIKTEFDSFAVESDRYYVIESDTGVATALGVEIRNDNDDFFVDAGDKCIFSQTSRLNADQGGSDPIFLGRIALLISGMSGSSSAHWWTLNPGGGWVNNPFANFAQTNESVNTSLWETYTTEADVFPANGTLYWFLGSGGVDGGGMAHHKDLDITMTLYVKGSILDVDGDYWATAQNRAIKEKIDEEVFTSDGPKRILPGATWKSTTELTDPDWYRLGFSESEHLKELTNLGRYRHQYRAQKRIEGQFKGVMCQPTGAPTIQLPLGFHRGFLINDVDGEFVLVPPLTIDYVQGLWRGTLIHSFLSTDDVAQTGDTHAFNYEFK